MTAQHPGTEPPADPQPDLPPTTPDLPEPGRPASPDVVPNPPGQIPAQDPLPVPPGEITPPIRG